MLTRFLTVLVACIASTGCVVSPGSTGAGGIASETFMIPALDPGIELHVRNKHLAERTDFRPERILLMVHGATFPSEVGFDIDLPGGSWMDYAASKGYDVYFVDVRGYGRSTRPSAMSLPPANSAPFANTSDAVNDVSAAVEFILKRRDVQRINLLGWSWGTTTMAGYAAANPTKVERLVLYAPVWYLPGSPDFSGAYRSTNGDQLRPNRARGVPAESLEKTFPAAWFEKWWAANLATDPDGARQSPPVLRSPNGVFKDFADIWSKGKSTYDPSSILAPTLLIVGEWDGTTPPTMAQELFKKLTSAKYRRLVVLSEGSHTLSVEKNRMHLIREVQSFLDEPTL